MSDNIDPAEEVELVLSFGTVQMLKEGNKVLELFAEDEVVREIISTIDSIYDAAVEYLDGMKEIDGIIEHDDDFEDDFEDDEDLVYEMESEDELI